MKLHNTLSRTTDSLTTIEPGKVRLYTCGPTVYDYQHLGNYAVYVRWDTLVRTLKASGFDVKWYMNITDVGHLISDADEGEDKLEKGAKREGKTAWEVAEFYTEDFKQNIRNLNISIPSDNLVRATDYVEEQIKLVQQLETNGYTYIIDDGVYFDSTKFADYGKMARLDTGGLQAGSRVEVGQKKHPTDFALWKLSPKDSKRDMEWDSPWGKGFPGWHLECSALAIHFLGESLDIHTGGIDHIPIHHTNEIAQSEAATGKKFANFWLHSNFLQINGTKISKSLGNTYTLKDLGKKNFAALDFRLFVLQSHYRTEANFTWELLESAHRRRLDLQAMADLRFQPIDKAKTQIENLKLTKQKVLKALQDDLNSPEALAALSQLGDVFSSGLATSDTEEFARFLQWLDEILGLQLTASSDINDTQKQLIIDRMTAKKTSDWQTSDALRDELAQQGIALRDTNTHTIWHRL